MMPDLHTKIQLMNSELDVVVGWRISGIEDNVPQVEVEEVTHETLGDLTGHVLKSQQGDLHVNYELDTGWQDPVRTAMFGRPTCYQPDDPRVRPDAVPYRYHANGPLLMMQREPIRRVLRNWSKLEEQLREEIEQHPDFDRAYQDYLDWLSEYP